MLSVIIKGIGLGLLLSISVGPVIFTILKLSLQYGHQAGFAFAAGVSLSDIILVVAGNVAAELVRMALQYEGIIGALGAALLIIMGAWSYFFRKDPVMDNGELADNFRKRDILRCGLQGFFMNLINPAPIIFWLTTCTAFAYLALHERIILFGSCLGVVLGTDLLKVMLAGKIRPLLTTATLHRINHFSALLLIAFGVAIAVGLVLNFS